MRRLLVGLLLPLLVVGPLGGKPDEGKQRPPVQGLRRSSFASDPGWESHRSRLLREHEPRRARQAFGYSHTRHAGGRSPGEVGGWIQRSVTPAWYALPLRNRTLEERLSASGRFAVTRAEGGSGMLFGWFHESSRGWRTNNSLVFRLDGNGGKYWVFFEYGTRHWLAGGAGCFEGDAYQTTKSPPFAADGTAHEWSLVYDPQAHQGDGEVTFTLDGTPYRLPLAPGHRADGATFSRFGMLNQQTSGDGLEVYFDDLVLGGERYTFDRDPGWEGRANRGELLDRYVRPLHDFGFSPTSFAGGSKGEVGGVIWRDEAPAFYADRVGPLSLSDELYAEGRIVLTHATSDSGVYLGWFAAGSRLKPPDPEGPLKQKDILGVMVEGPSRAGHYFRAAYGTSAGEGKLEEEGPGIRADGRPHRWSIRYTPGAGGGAGRIVVRFDGHEQVTEVAPEHARQGATFDRFGLFNIPWGGLFVEVYLDDLRYTAERTAARGTEGA